MRRVFKRRLWMQVIAIILVMALNLGALDGLIRVTVQELALGAFDGLLKGAAAKNVEVEKNKNTLPDSAGPKKHVNPAAEEARENREVKEKRTPNSKTYKIGEEEFKTEVFQDPIHYVNEKNELVDIDNTLVQSADKDFAFENRANSLKVRFADKAGEKKLGQLQHKEFSIKWYLSDGQEAAGNTSRNTITYSGVKENTDLRYIIDGSTLKEDIILNSPDAPAEFKFVVNLKNLDYEAQEDGSINFVDPRSGNVVWVMPKPFMYDAGGERSEAVTANLENKWGRLVLTITADKDWISAANRNFPIVIDPTLQPGPSDGRDTFISSNHPETNYRPDDYLYVGKSPAYGDTRSFFYFDNLTTEKDITVTDAKFYAYATEGSLTSINLYPVQVDWQWDTNTLDWSFWQKNGKLGGLVDTATGANGWLSFDITSLVQQWVDKPSANFGLALFPAGGSGYREFISCDHGDAGLRPKLVYTYTKGPVGGPASFKLHIDRKTGLIKADGTAVADARIYLTTDDGRTFTTTADSAGKWKKSGMSFEKGKTKTISTYYEYEIEVTDAEGNTSTITVRSDTTSQTFLIAIYSKGARTKKLAKFYYKDGTKAAKLKADNEIKTELEMVVGDYVLVLDPMRNMPYTAGPIIKDPDEEYRLREKIRPLYYNSEIINGSIDVTSGNFFALETDLTFDAQGLPIKFYRVLNSQEPEMYRGPLGQNWHLGYDKMLVMYEDGSVLATGGDGGGIFFRPSGGGFTADPDVTERLVKNGDGTYAVITKYNTVYHFDTDGMLDSITDRNGNTISLTYDPEGLLKEVTDAGGRATRLYYDELGRITLLEDPAGRQVEYAYDSGGRLSRVTDPNGGVTRYGYDGLKITTVIDPMENEAVTNTYDDQGRVTRQEDAEGYYVSLTYSGNSTTFTDKNGHDFLYTFDSQYRVTSIDGPDTDNIVPARQSAGQVQALRFRAGDRGFAAADPEVTTADAGSESTTGTSASTTNLPLVQYRYDSRGNRVEVTDAKGNPTYYQYDGRNNLTAALNSDGKGSRYVYESANNVTEVTDPLNNKTHMTYDAKGNLLTVTDAAGNTSRYTYDSSGQVLTVTDPAGKRVEYAYDQAGNVISVTDGRGNITRYGYDAIGRNTGVTDPRGNHTYYVFDGNGNLLKEISPAGEVVNSYDFNNNLTGARDAEGNVTTYRYDRRGYIVEETDPLLVTTVMTYDGNGNQVSSQDANRNTTRYAYDVLGRLKLVTDPAGDTYEAFYDPNGNRVVAKDAKGQVTRFEYDKFNRLLAVIDPLNQRREYAYDDLGNTRFYTDTGGAVTEYRYDALSRVVETIDTLGQSTGTTYDPSGNRRTVTNALGQTYTYFYDENNNLQRVIDPAGNATEFQYDANNNRVAVKDALGNVTRFEFDNLNRLVRVSDPLNRDNRIGLDKNGNRTSVTDGNGHTTNYRYDPAGRLRFVIDARGNTTEYRYDDTGNLRFFIDANRHMTEYRYNSKNLLTQSINPLGQATAFEYDQNGNITAKTDPNGSRVEYDYDPMNRLLGAYYPDGSYVEYGYNRQGQREWMEDPYGTIWYDHDDLGRLLAVTNQDDLTTEYGYNEIGRKTMVRYPYGKEVRYGYDSLNRLNKVTDRLGKTTAYHYDAVGRRTKTALPNGVVTSYDYNIANQLTGIASINADQKMLAKYGYQYDGAGNRITKLSAMTQPEHDNGTGNDPGFVPPGQEKAKKQQADLIYMLAKGGGGGGSGGGSGGGGNSGGSGGGGNNGNGNSKDKGDNGRGPYKDKANGKADDKPKNKDIPKEEREKKKEQAKTKNGYRQKGKYTNRGKHKGWYKNGKLPGDKVEVTYYLNDVSDPLTKGADDLRRGRQV